MKAKKGNKGGRKHKKKNGGTRSSSKPKNKLKQPNLNGDLVETLDVGGFGDIFQVQMLDFRTADHNSKVDTTRRVNMALWLWLSENITFYLLQNMDCIHPI